MIAVLAVCRNEEVMLPFFLQHYDFADEIVLFDDESEDRTREIAAADPRVRLCSLHTDGKLRDDLHQLLKNEAWRATSADWLIAVDVDEFLWHPDVRSLLAGYDAAGVSHPLVEGWHMVGTGVPAAGIRLTEVIREGARGLDYGKGLVDQDIYDKRVCFKRGVAPQFGPGAHTCRPCGLARPSPKPDLKLLHFKFLSLDYALAKGRKIRRSEQNVAAGWGHHVNDEEMTRRWYASLSAAKVRVI